MSHDSEIAEMGRAMNERRKERHAEWHLENRGVLEAAQASFRAVNNDETFLFREGTHKADFYPSTGRWRASGKTYRGGAKAFLAFWKKETAK